MSTVKPEAFTDLGLKELRRSAIEDFAVDVDEKDGAKVIVAALLESGVKWADYLAQHPEHAPEEAVVNNVVTSSDVLAGSTPETIAAVEQTVLVKEDAPLTEEKYLIKMDRKNPLFEVAGHRFTSEHPYAIVTAEQAQFILTSEVGFRQATPDEAQEFYS